jgi:hypothetical protein
MAPADVAKAYIYRLCNQIGVNADSIYNAKTGAWYFTSGSSTIELFLTTIERGLEAERTFVRCFAPVCAIPDDAKEKLAIFKIALEINTDRMGVKLCAVTERDIDGMDYQEFISIISDISYWADHLKDYFKTHFS